MSQEKLDVMILDDNKDIGFMMESILQYAGYKTKACVNQQQLFEMMAQGHPRLILMDMLLSGADGKDICRELKAASETSHIPIIMISAHPDAERACREAGADEFLEKPFELDIFLNKAGFFLLKTDS